MKWGASVHVKPGQQAFIPAEDHPNAFYASICWSHMTPASVLVSPFLAWLLPILGKLDTTAMLRNSPI